MYLNPFRIVSVALVATACGSIPTEPGNGNPPTDGECEATQGTCYYLAPNAGSGAGTFDDPFGLDDLPKNNTGSCDLSSRAFEALQPGDFLYFREGHYEFSGCDGSYYYRGYVRTARSGTADAPITFSAYPGETVQLTVVAGGQPAMGTDGHDYIRFIGFIVDGGLGRFYGTGIEVAYNDVRGTFVDTPDNHDGIRIENAVGIWVHHNMIHGVTGQGANSAGIKVYTSSDAVIEDNYIYGNTVGVYDKDSGINNTYRRNYFTGNEEYEWYGNNQGEYASPKIYDNVIDGEVSLHSHTNGAEVHDNLIRGNMLVGAWAGDTWNTHLWNNVVISGANQVTAYREPRNPFTTAEPNPHLRYMDFNVYDAPPTYRFGEYSSNPSTFNLGQMQGRGFELNSQVATGVYADQVSYVLNEAWRTAGRYGDAVGPDDVATILDVTRYGPSAR